MTMTLAHQIVDVGALVVVGLVVVRVVRWMV